MDFTTSCTDTNQDYPWDSQMPEMAGTMESGEPGPQHRRLDSVPEDLSSSSDEIRGAGYQEVAGPGVTAPANDTEEKIPAKAGSPSFRGDNGEGDADRVLGIRDQDLGGSMVQPYRPRSLLTLPHEMICEVLSFLIDQGNYERGMSFYSQFDDYLFRHDYSFRLVSRQFETFYQKLQGGVWYIQAILVRQRPPPPIRRIAVTRMVNLSIADGYLNEYYPEAETHLGPVSSPKPYCCYLLPGLHPDGVVLRVWFQGTPAQLAESSSLVTRGHSWFALKYLSRKSLAFRQTFPDVAIARLEEQFMDTYGDLGCLLRHFKAGLSPIGLHHYWYGREPHLSYHYYLDTGCHAPEELVTHGVAFRTPNLPDLALSDYQRMIEMDESDWVFVSLYTHEDEEHLPGVEDFVRHLIGQYHFDPRDYAGLQNPMTKAEELYLCSMLWESLSLLTAVSYPLRHDHQKHLEFEGYVVNFFQDIKSSVNVRAYKHVRKFFNLMLDYEDPDMWAHITRTFRGEAWKYWELRPESRKGDGPQPKPATKRVWKLKNPPPVEPAAQAGQIENPTPQGPKAEGKVGSSDAKPAGGARPAKAPKIRGQKKRSHENLTAEALKSSTDETAKPRRAPKTPSISSDPNHMPKKKKPYAPKNDLEETCYLKSLTKGPRADRGSYWVEYRGADKVWQTMSRLVCDLSPVLQKEFSALSPQEIYERLADCPVRVRWNRTKRQPKRGDQEAWDMHVGQIVHVGAKPPKPVQTPNPPRKIEAKPTAVDEAKRVNDILSSPPGPKNRVPAEPKPRGGAEKKGKKDRNEKPVEQRKDDKNAQEVDKFLDDCIQNNLNIVRHIESQAFRDHSNNKANAPDVLLKTKWKVTTADCLADFQMSEIGYCDCSGAQADYIYGPIGLNDAGDVINGWILSRNGIPSVHSPGKFFDFGESSEPEVRREALRMHSMIGLRSVRPVPMPCCHAKGYLGLLTQKYFMELAAREIMFERALADGITEVKMMVKILTLPGIIKLSADESNARGRIEESYQQFWRDRGIDTQAFVYNSCFLTTEESMVECRKAQDRARAQYTVSTAAQVMASMNIAYHSENGPTTMKDVMSSVWQKEMGIPDVPKLNNRGRVPHVDRALAMMGTLSDIFTENINKGLETFGNSRWVKSLKERRFHAAGRLREVIGDGENLNENAIQDVIRDAAADIIAHLNVAPQVPQQRAPPLNDEQREMVNDLVEVVMRANSVPTAPRSESVAVETAADGTQAPEVEIDAISVHWEDVAGPQAVPQPENLPVLADDGQAGLPLMIRVRPAVPTEIEPDPELPPRAEIHGLNDHVARPPGHPVPLNPITQTTAALYGDLLCPIGYQSYESQVHCADYVRYIWMDYCEQLGYKPRRPWFRTGTTDLATLLDRMHGDNHGRLPGKIWVTGLGAAYEIAVQAERAMADSTSVPMILPGIIHLHFAPGALGHARIYLPESYSIGEFFNSQALFWAWKAGCFLRTFGINYGQWSLADALGMRQIRRPGGRYTTPLPGGVLVVRPRIFDACLFDLRFRLYTSTAQQHLRACVTNASSKWTVPADAKVHCICRSGTLLEQPGLITQTEARAVVQNSELADYAARRNPDVVQLGCEDLIPMCMAAMRVEANIVGGISHTSEAVVLKQRGGKLATQLAQIQAIPHWADRVYVQTSTGRPHPAAYFLFNVNYYGVVKCKICNLNQPNATGTCVKCQRNQVCPACNSRMLPGVGCAIHGLTLDGKRIVEPHPYVRDYVRRYVETRQLILPGQDANQNVEVPKFMLPSFTGVGKKIPAINPEYRVTQETHCSYKPSFGPVGVGLCFAKCPPLLYSADTVGYWASFWLRNYAASLPTFGLPERALYRAAARLIAQEFFQPEEPLRMPAVNSPEFRRELIEALTESSASASQKRKYLRGLDRAIAQGVDKINMKIRAIMKNEMRDGYYETQNLWGTPPSAEPIWTPDWGIDAQRPGNPGKLTTARIIQFWNDGVVGSVLMVLNRKFMKKFKTFHGPNNNFFYAGGRNGADVGEALHKWMNDGKCTFFQSRDFSAFDSRQVHELFREEVKLRKIVHPGVFEDPIIGTIFNLLDRDVGTDAEVMGKIPGYKKLVRVFRVKGISVRWSGDQFTTFGNSKNNMLFNAVAMGYAWCLMHGQPITPQNILRGVKSGDFGVAVVGDDQILKASDPRLFRYLEMAMSRINMTTTGGAPYAYHQLGRLDFLGGRLARACISRGGQMRPVVALLPCLERFLSKIGYCLNHDVATSLITKDGGRMTAEQWMQQVALAYYLTIGAFPVFRVILRHLMRLTGQSERNREGYTPEELQRIIDTMRELDPAIAHKMWKLPGKCPVIPTQQTEQDMAMAYAHGKVERLRDLELELDDQLAKINNLPCLIQSQAVEEMLACALRPWSSISSEELL